MSPDVGRSYNGVRFVSSYRGTVDYSGPAGRFEVGRRVQVGADGWPAGETYYVRDQATADLLTGFLSAKRAALLVWGEERGIPADRWAVLSVVVDAAERDALVYGGASWY